MQISSKGKYSVRALVDLAQHSNGAPVALVGISRREGISLLFLEQLFQQLRKGNIVKSVRGPHGGYVLARDPAEITVGEILRLVEPPLYTSSCFSKAEPVDSCKMAESCTGHALWKQLSEHIDNFLDTITVADLCKPKPQVVYQLKLKSERILASSVRQAETEVVEVV